MHLPSDLLSRPAAEGVRRVALGLLERTDGAWERLSDPHDAEALHDFRVALRRLRSTLRGFEPQVADSVSKKLARRLSKLAKATSGGRDLEVHLAWLAGERPRLRPHERRGLDWLAQRLRERQEDAGDELERVRQEYPALSAKLRRRLSRYRLEVDLTGKERPQPFATAAAAAIAAHSQEFAARLDEVSSAADESQAHAARIQAKRLRYLLEPLAELDEVAGAGSELDDLVRSLRALQDLLGEANDLRLLASEVAAGLEAAAAARAREAFAAALSAAEEAAEAGEAAAGSDPPARRALRARERPGLLALTRHLAERRSDLFGQFSRRWLEGRAESFFSAVTRATERLTGSDDQEPG